MVMRKKPFIIEVCVEEEHMNNTYFHFESEWFSDAFAYVSIPRAIQALPRVVRYIQRYVDHLYDEEDLGKSRVIRAQVVSAVWSPRHKFDLNPPHYEEEYHRIFEDGKFITRTTKTRMTVNPVQSHQPDEVTMDAGRDLSLLCACDGDGFVEVEDAD